MVGIIPSQAGSGHISAQSTWCPLSGPTKHKAQKGHGQGKKAGYISTHLAIYIPAHWCDQLKMGPFYRGVEEQRVISLNKEKTNPW